MKVRKSYVGNPVACNTYKKTNIRYAMKVSGSYVGNPVIRIKDTLYDMQ